jgi:hypothetical protein
MIELPLPLLCSLQEIGAEREEGPGLLASTPGLPLILPCSCPELCIAKGPTTTCGGRSSADFRHLAFSRPENHSLVQLSRPIRYRMFRGPSLSRSLFIPVLSGFPSPPLSSALLLSFLSGGLSPDFSGVISFRTRQPLAILT